MKRLFPVLIFITIIIGYFFISGCSDDKEDVTEPVPKEEGDTLDAVFNEAVQTFYLANTAVNDGYSQLRSMMLNMVAPKSLDYYYDSIKQYWYFEDSAEVFGVIKIRKDSIQFFHVDGVVKEPDTAFLIGIEGGIYFREMKSVSGPSMGDRTTELDTLELLQVRARIFGPLGELPSEGEAVITSNGRVLRNIEDIDIKSPSVCKRKIDVAFSAYDMAVDLIDYLDNGRCAISGSTGFSGTIDLDCTNDTTFVESDRWIMTLTFENNAVSTRVENSTHFWESIRPCE